MSPWIDWDAVWKIVVVGLLAGAGLPAIFAIGLRALSGRPQPAAVVVPATGLDEGSATNASLPGILAAGTCFAVVLAAIGLGIYSIVASS